MRIGVSVNHNHIAGQKNPSGAKDIELTDEKRQQLQDFIDDCDFIGVSSYFPVSVPPTKDDFVRGIDRCMAEFRQYGLSVPTTKPLQFSEVGIGGRSSQQGDHDVHKAAEKPWEGAGTLRHSAWRDLALRELRHQYHTALLDFLVSQPAPYRVSAAFFWSSGSWDPWGRTNPDFADRVITAAIERHNRLLEARP
jgi:hypothetical protein